MSIIQLDPECPCPACGHGATLREPCECDGVYDCPHCANTGIVRACPLCDWSTSRSQKSEFRSQGLENSNGRQHATRNTQLATDSAGRSAQRSAAASAASGHPGSLAAGSQQRGPQGLAPTPSTPSGQSAMEQPLIARRIVWMLQSTQGAALFDPPRFWTGVDYSADLTRGLKFTSLADAHRWIDSHKHLRGLLQIAEVIHTPSNGEQET